MCWESLWISLDTTFLAFQPKEAKKVTETKYKWQQKKWLPTDGAALLYFKHTNSHLNASA